MVLDPILEQTVPRSSLRRKAKVQRAATREPSPLQRWATSKITALRPGQTALYIGTVYFALSAFAAGIPSFDIAAPDGWTPIWASVLTLGGAVAAIGSASDRDGFEITEFVGSIFTFVPVATYAAVLLGLAYGEGDVNRAAAGAGFVALALPPGFRMVWFMLQIKRWRANAQARRAGKAAPFATQSIGG